MMFYGRVRKGEVRIGLPEKAFTTETQRARRRKKGRFGGFFSVNLYHSLCVLRVSVVF